MGDWTLAIGGSEHDASAALMRGLDIRVAIEQERLSRRKHGVAHWYESPIQRAVEYCLASEGISLKDVSRVVASDSVPARIYRELSGLDVRTYHHHLCHAASAAMMLPPGNVAGVLVYDGYGSIRGPVPGTTLYRIHPATPASNNTINMCHEIRRAAAGTFQAQTTAIAKGRDKYVSIALRARKTLPYMIFPIKKLG